MHPHRIIFSAGHSAHSCRREFLPKVPAERCRRPWRALCLHCGHFRNDRSKFRHRRNSAAPYRPAIAFNFCASVMVHTVGRTDWISILVLRPTAARELIVHRCSNQSGKRRDVSKMNLTTCLRCRKQTCDAAGAPRPDGARLNVGP